MIDEISIPTTEIEADGFITRAETLERVNAKKAKPIEACIYPKCEECWAYCNHYCTIPMVITKQIYRLFEERLDILKRRVDELDALVTDEILGSKKDDAPNAEVNYTWADYIGEDK